MNRDFSGHTVVHVFPETTMSFLLVDRATQAEIIHKKDDNVHICVRCYITSAEQGENQHAVFHGSVISFKSRYSY